MKYQVSSQTRSSTGNLDARERTIEFKVILSADNIPKGQKQSITCVVGLSKSLRKSEFVFEEVNIVSFLLSNLESLN